MPDEAYWESLFDIPTITDWLDLKNSMGPIVEIGCGYGTFTVPIASQSGHEVITFDIDQEMTVAATKKAKQRNLPNVSFTLRDVVTSGTGLEANTTGMVLLFNILHSRDNKALLEESCRILKPGGRIAIIHWRKDIPTPRGPDIDGRPNKDGILKAIDGLDLKIEGHGKNLEPYHWGIQLVKGDRP